MRKNAVVLKMRGHTDTVTGMELSPDGSYLLSNAMDNSGTCCYSTEIFISWQIYKKAWFTHVLFLQLCIFYENDTERSLSFVILIWFFLLTFLGVGSKENIIQI